MCAYRQVGPDSEINAPLQPKNLIAPNSVKSPPPQGRRSSEPTEGETEGFAKPENGIFSFLPEHYRRALITQIVAFSLTYGALIIGVVFVILIYTSRLQSKDFQAVNTIADSSAETSSILRSISPVFLRGLPVARQEGEIVTQATTNKVNYIRCHPDLFCAYAKTLTQQLSTSQPTITAKLYDVSSPYDPKIGTGLPTSKTAIPSNSACLWYSTPRPRYYMNPVCQDLELFYRVKMMAPYNDQDLLPKLTLPSAKYTLDYTCPISSFCAHSNSGYFYSVTTTDARTGAPMFAMVSSPTQITVAPTVTSSTTGTTTTTTTTANGGSMNADGSVSTISVCAWATTYANVYYPLFTDCRYGWS